MSGCLALGGKVGRKELQGQKKNIRGNEVHGGGSCINMYIKYYQVVYFKYMHFMCVSYTPITLFKTKIKVKHLCEAKSETPISHCPLSLPFSLVTLVIWYLSSFGSSF